tara:strand:+ start:3063 stop:4856 length:1794 start_codon:yes stop_codon:yes gene_type:complete
MLRMSSTPDTPIGSRRKANTVYPGLPYVSNNNNNNQKSVARPGTSKRPLNNNNQKSVTRRVKTKNAINTIYPNIRKPVNGTRGVVAQRTGIPPNFSKKVPDLKPAKNKKPPKQTTTKKPPKQTTTKKPKTVTQPSTKSKNLSNVLLSRINNFTNQKNKNVARGLSYLYESNKGIVPNTHTQNVFKNAKTVNNQFTLMKKQVNHISSDTKHIKFSKNKIDLISSNNDFNLNFLFLVYLDMVHDKTYTGSSFKTFLNSDIAKILFNKSVPPFKITTMMNNIMKITDSINKNNTNTNIRAKKGFETAIKTNLEGVFGVNEWSKQTIKASNLDITKSLYITLDAERSATLGAASGVGSSISSIISNSKKNKQRLLKPLFTVGSLTDPGSGYLQRGLKFFAPNIVSKDPSSSAKWCLQLMTFNINDKMNVKMGFDDKNNTYTCKINENDIPVGTRRNNANTTVTAISKFMGDFTQVLYNVSLMKHYEKSRQDIKDKLCLGTNDGSLSLMYAFMVHNLVGKMPKMILDMSKNNEIIIYNLHGFSRVPSTPSRATNNTVYQGRTPGLSTVQGRKTQSRTTGLSTPQGGRTVAGGRLNKTRRGLF